MRNINHSYSTLVLLSLSLSSLVSVYIHLASSLGLVFVYTMRQTYRRMCEK